MLSATPARTRGDRDYEDSALVDSAGPFCGADRIPLGRTGPRSARGTVAADRQARAFLCAASDPRRPAAVDCRAQGQGMAAQCLGVVVRFVQGGAPAAAAACESRD